MFVTKPTNEHFSPPAFENFLDVIWVRLQIFFLFVQHEPLNKRYIFGKLLKGKLKRFILFALQTKFERKFLKDFLKEQTDFFSGITKK